MNQDIARQQNASASPDMPVALILSSPREQLYLKLTGMRYNNLTAKEKEKADQHEKWCMDAFAKVCWNWNRVGISREQISMLTESEFHALEQEVARYAPIRAWIPRVALFPFAFFPFWVGLRSPLFILTTALSFKLQNGAL